MENKFTEDYYIFCTPKHDPDANSHIKLLLGPFAGVVLVINYIKIRRKYFSILGPYVLKYNYTIVENPKNMKDNNSEFQQLVGDLVMDIWEKYYA